MLKGKNTNEMSNLTMTFIPDRPMISKSFINPYWFKASITDYSDIMGRIKTKLVKRKSRELMNSYGDQMSDDFDQNKAIAEKYMEFPSKQVILPG